MPLKLPTTLSPSKLTSFTDCGLAFRFSAVEKLPEPPSVHLTRGTLVHAALELLFHLDRTDRTRASAQECLDRAVKDMADDPEWDGLDLDPDSEATLVAESSDLIDKYFQLEDPSRIHPIGLELMLEATIGGVRLRGIIDRLDLIDGELVVTDYKTGRSPGEGFEKSRMVGVQFYALLCEAVFGRRPARIQLLHLADPIAVIADVSERSTRALERKVQAVWTAVERACEREDFKPRPSRLCDWCSFQTWCPAFGGDPAQAAVELGQKNVPADPAQQRLMIA